MKNVDEIKQAILERMDYLRWSIYRLTKKKIEHNGSNLPVTRYHTSLSKLLENPQKCRLSNVIEVITLLGGDIHIEWDESMKPEMMPSIPNSLMKVQRLETENQLMKEKIAQLENQLKQMENSENNVTLEKA